MAPPSDTQRKRYPSDLTEAEWALLVGLVPPPKPGGRPAKYPRREIVNAILYVLRTGCAWRQLPHDLPPWISVYLYFRGWRRDGTWDGLHERLRGDLRVAEGRQRQPSAAILDSQSVKTTEKGGFTAMTPARRSTAASAICSSTRWAWSLPWSSMRPTSRIGTGPSWCSKSCGISSYGWC